MKQTFLGHARPLLVDMILAETPGEIIINIRNALYDGADAFGIQLERLCPEYRTEEHFRRIFSYMEDKPLYVTNYRGGHNREMTDEARIEELKLALKCGATLIDIPGDEFSPAPMEMTQDAKAIERQKQLIEDIHEAGGEVLMSSHIRRFLPEEKVVEIALEQQSRGADIVKMVTGSDTEEELMTNLNTIQALKRELKVPFLFLSGGPYCKIHRMFGPYFGVCMWLCVQKYDTFSSKEQPVLRAVRNIVANFDYKPNLRQ